MKLTISLAQTNIRLGHIEDNLEQANQWTTEAARLGSQLILLPELWTTGYALSRAADLAQENRLSVLPRLASLAREYRMAICGSLLLEKGGKVYNTLVFQPPCDESPLMYSKIHLFRLMEEDRWLTAGNDLRQVGEDWGSAGLAICYDLRFPEMFRRYALNGARLLLISAEWPLRRAAHWQALLRARAIENQFFVAATNSVGETGGETFGGCSALLSPWGETILEAGGQQPELLTAEIDLEQANEVRQQIPILQDRRPDIYG